MGTQARVSRFHQELQAVVEVANQQYDDNYEAHQKAFRVREKELDALFDKYRHRFKVGLPYVPSPRR